MNMLDRGGFSPKQVLEHRHSLEGGLTIRHIREVAKPKQMPTIDVDAKDITVHVIKEDNNGNRP
jgi:hypothetical protein